MRIALTALIYDRDPEHSQLSKMLASSVEAGVTDFVLSLDRKSIEGTREWIGEHYPQAILLDHDLNAVDDFALLRNRTVAAVPRECEWFLWIDMDDVLECRRTIPEVIEMAQRQQPDVICIRSNYQYDQDEYGNLNTVANRRRVMKNDRVWTWRSRLHEDIHPEPIGIELTTKDVIWKHDAKSQWRDSSDRNLRILKKMLEDDPNDPRAHVYMGSQLFHMREYQKSAEHFERYCELSGWTGEKWYSRIMQAACYRSLGLYQKAIKADQDAVDMFPFWPDGHFGMGETYALMGEWEKARTCGEIGLKHVAENSLPDPRVVINPLAYSFNWTTWMSTVYFNLGQEDKALRVIEEGLKVRPEPALVEKRDHLKAALQKRAAAKDAVKVASYLADHSEAENALRILEMLPAGERRKAGAEAVRQTLAERVQHTTSSVALRDTLWEREPVFDDRTPWITWAGKRLLRMGAEKVLVIGDPSAALHLAEICKVTYLGLDPGSAKATNWKAVESGLMSTTTIKDYKVKEAEEQDITVPDMTGPLTAIYASPEGIFKAATRGRSHKEGSYAFDAVLLADVLDRVGSVPLILEQSEKLAPRVLAYVPNGDYEGPIEPDPMRVRRYDYHDAGRLIRDRGLVVELHNVADGSAEGRLVMEWAVGEKPEAADLPVIFWAFHTAQDWTPDSIEEGGVGGSETALIRVAEEFALRGHPVKVWANAEGCWNGVRYEPTELFRPQECWLFVAWRQVGPLAKMADFAMQRALWCHDVSFGPMPNSWVNKGTIFFGLSTWHAQYLRDTYHGIKVVKTGNAIDPERFDNTDVIRQKHRLIWASSPDRGLLDVLQMWPKIRERHPDASLSVFYGFDLTEKYDPEYATEVKGLMKQEGVTYVGRVDQTQLAREYLASDVWLYPSYFCRKQPFSETYCISAVEAQAAGCVPITTDWGGLDDTNATGIKVKSKDDLLDALFRFWDLPEEEQDKYREKGKKWAREQTWDKVVDGWISALLEDAEENAIIEKALAEALA